MGKQAPGQAGLSQHRKNLLNGVRRSMSEEIKGVEESLGIMKFLLAIISVAAILFFPVLTTAVEGLAGLSIPPAWSLIPIGYILWRVFSRASWLETLDADLAQSKYERLSKSYASPRQRLLKFRSRCDALIELAECADPVIPESSLEELCERVVLTFRLLKTSSANNAMVAYTKILIVHFDQRTIEHMGIEQLPTKPTTRGLAELLVTLRDRTTEDDMRLGSARALKPLVSHKS